AAVNDVTAAGVIYFSSAGNWGNLTYGHSGTFEGDYVPSAAALPNVIAATGETGDMHMFPSGLSYTTLVPGTFNDGRTDLIQLKWSDASNASINDYDLFVLDSTETKILGLGVNPPGGAPYEQASCDLTREALDPVNKSIPSPCDQDASHTCSTATFKRFC